MSTHDGGRTETKDSETNDEKLDEALDQSFPASDPPAQTEPVIHVGTKKTPEKKQH